MTSQAMFSEYAAVNVRIDALEEQMHRENQELKATMKESTATIEILKGDLDSERKFSDFRAKCFLDKEKHSQRVIDNLQTSLGSYLKHLSNAKAATIEQTQKNIQLFRIYEESKVDAKKAISNFELVKGVNKQLNDCINIRESKIQELNDYINLLHNVLERHRIFEEQETKHPVEVDCSGYESHLGSQQNFNQHQIYVDSSNSASSLQQVSSEAVVHQFEAPVSTSSESCEIPTATFDNSCDDHAHVNSTSAISPLSTSTNKKLKKRQSKKSKCNYSLIYSIASL